MILAYGGIPYKEEDCSSYFGQTFQQVKAAGKLPLGQVRSPPSTKSSNGR